MCTAVSLTVKDNYFGRNLDYEHTFGEKITITPRKYPFKFRCAKEICSHYAIIGMAVVMDNYPLYFDGTNEKGLSMAGLNFPDNACYMKSKRGKDNIASFEFIPWILTQCSDVLQAKQLIENINIIDEAFNIEMPPSPLHWIIADKFNAITVEQTKSGLNIYENPVGVLTNNPEFDFHMINLNNYMSVSPKDPINLFSDKITLKTYGRGMGGLGIPGDLSSVSRFVKASFTKLNSVCDGREEEAVNHFFHILYSVCQQRGCVKVGDLYEITNYTSCCNTDKGIYYYSTYNNLSITAVDMHRENLEGMEIVSYNPNTQWKILYQN